jgi:hypothetical protein
MKSNQLKTPVALLIFNRPDTTQQVFDAVRQVKPDKLLVVADGPRLNKSNEDEKCSATRAIIEQVDWPCEVVKCYSDVNMGCKLRVSTGLDWIFNTVESAIIIEDDCLPNKTFFQFCEDMLNKYWDDERIMMISGTNYLGEWKSKIQSYHFSYYGGIWGWASWRRAWQYYDVNMRLWADQEMKDRVKDVISDEKQYMAREKSFEETFLGRIDTWDYQWSLARLLQSGLSIVPAVNLVSNLGFRDDATHTKSQSHLANMSNNLLNFPLKFNDFTVVDREYDRLLFEKIVKPDSEKNIVAKFKDKIRNLVTSIK